MKTIPITASTPYTVSIGNGLLAAVGETVRKLTKAQTVCIVTDSNVRFLHARSIFRTVFHSLTDAGLSVCCFTIPAGEASKNSENYLLLLDTLAKENMTRTDCIVALGGGVVGDLAGFAAATYLRGIPYIQIPTTLLAMVDSSVGGKTGIDLPSGKNLCGAFWQPAAVLCDTEALATLPDEIFRDGCAEVIKYGILYDPTLFSHLEAKGMSFDRESVIARCVELKCRAVEVDEFDRGARKLLNLGHTVGHAIESCSDYQISHGQAVAAGTAIVARAAACPDRERITSLLTQFGLPTATAFSAADLAQAALSDKKRSGSSLDLILPTAIGNCQIVPTPITELQAFIEKGL